MSRFAVVTLGSVGDLHPFVGVARALAWPHAPRAITATAYVAAGWVAVSEVRTLAAALPAATIPINTAGMIILWCCCSIWRFRIKYMNTIFIRSVRHL